MDCVEYDEWKEFYRVEPWGLAVDDQHWATHINYLVAVNAASDHKWIPTRKLFPRTEADVKHEEKAEADADLLHYQLRAAFMEHNAAVEAKEQPSP